MCMCVQMRGAISVRALYAPPILKPSALAGSMAQLAIALLVAAYFLAAHIKCQPFLDDAEDNLQSFSLISSVLTLTLAMMIRSHAYTKEEFKELFPYDNPPAIILFVANIMTGVLAVYMALKAIKKRMMDNMRMGELCCLGASAMLSCICGCFAASAPKKSEESTDEARSSPPTSTQADDSPPMAIWPMGVSEDFRVETGRDASCTTFRGCVASSPFFNENTAETVAASPEAKAPAAWSLQNACGSPRSPQHSATLTEPNPSSTAWQV